MRDFLRDIGLAFCPASVRTVYRPHSPSRVVLAATLTGALQAIACSRWFFSGLMAFVSLRGRQLGHAVQPANQSTQAWLVLVLACEYLLFHPLALFLFYMALEGFVRFAGGLCVSEAIPTLPVVLAFRAKAYIDRRRAQRALQPLAAIPDSFEVLPDGERLRIAASLAKPRWNASLTIGIDGEWYEVEREERGSSPRPYVYVLRRAPIGKALRGYEEYDPAVVVKEQ